MKMDQVAFYASTNEQALQIKEQFGLEASSWIQDTVTARSIVNGKEGENVAELQFNYDLGVELEILRYIKGPRWHQTNPLCADAAVLRTGQWVFPSFISHIGIHLDDGEEFPEMKHCKLVQETFTISHTSEYLTKVGSPGYGRLYHYRIFEMSPGSYIKYIKRRHAK